MGFILQNTVEYDFDKAYTHVQAITIGFTAHLSSFFLINSGVLACPVMEEIDISLWLCYL